jgi:hypothetical protein
VALLDAKGTTFAFDGLTIGRVIRYDMSNAKAPAPVVVPLPDGKTISKPGVADYGTCALELYLDLSDAGVARARTALANREVLTLTATTTDGNGLTGRAFVQEFPISGALDSTQKSRLVFKWADLPSPL